MSFKVTWGWMSISCLEIQLPGHIALYFTKITKKSQKRKVQASSWIMRRAPGTPLVTEGTAGGFQPWSPRIPGVWSVPIRYLPTYSRSKHLLLNPFPSFRFCCSHFAFLNTSQGLSPRDLQRLIRKERWMLPILPQANFNYPVPTSSPSPYG